MVNVLNIRERELPVAIQQAGVLIDSLSSRDDVLWPTHSWPRMAFDRPLRVGASGGHGPIRYVVAAYTPGRSIQFRFTGPRGFIGYHGYVVTSTGTHSCELRHRLEMQTHGPARISWPLVFKPLHDALIEDSLASAQVALGLAPNIQPWSVWVRMLRWVFAGGKSRSQMVAPANKPCQSKSRLRIGLRIGLRRLINSQQMIINSWEEHVTFCRLSAWDIPNQRQDAGSKTIV